MKAKQTSKNQKRKLNGRSPVQCSALLAELVKLWRYTAKMNRELCKMLPKEPEAEWREAATAATCFDYCANRLEKVISANKKLCEGSGQ